MPPVRSVDLYEMYYWNAAQQQSRIKAHKWNQKQIHTRVIDSNNLPRDTQVKVILVAGPLLKPVTQKLCRCKHSFYTSRKFVYCRKLICVGIFFVFPKAFSTAYRDKEKLAERTIRWQVATLEAAKRLCAFENVVTTCCKAFL